MEVWFNSRSKNAKNGNNKNNIPFHLLSTESFIIQKYQVTFNVT